MLIGSEVYWELVTGKVISGQSGPTAIHTKIGWVLSGPTDREETAVDLILTSTHALRIDCYPAEQSLDDHSFSDEYPGSSRGCVLRY